MAMVSRTTLTALLLLAIVHTLAAAEECELYGQTIQFRGIYETDQHVNSEVMDGEYTVTSGSAKLLILRQDADGLPYLVSEVSTEESLFRIGSLGQLAVGKSYYGDRIYLVDWRDPHDIAISAPHEIPITSRSVRRIDDRIFVAADLEGVWIYEYDDAGTAELMAVVPTVEAAFDVTMHDGTLVVFEATGFRVYDIENPTDPDELDYLELPEIGGYQGTAYTVESDGTWLAAMASYGGMAQWCFVLTLVDGDLSILHDKRTYGGLCKIRDSILYSREGLGGGTSLHTVSVDTMVEIAHFLTQSSGVAVGDEVLAVISSGTGSEDKVLFYDSTFKREVPVAVRWTMVDELEARVRSVSSEFLTASTLCANIDETPAPW